MHTVKQAADKLGISPRTVQKWCKLLGIERVGRDYILSDDDVERVAAAAQDRPGRPSKA